MNKSQSKKGAFISFLLQTLGQCCPRIADNSVSFTARQYCLLCGKWIYNQSQLLQDATSGPVAKLGAFIRAHPENLVPNDNNVEDKIYYQNFAYIRVK